MCPVSTKQLAAALPSNIQYLASLIARKPQEYCDQWAATADEAFSLYTRTRTVNLILSLNDALAESGWPFPSFLDLRKELKVKSWPLTSWRLLWLQLRGSALASMALTIGTDDVQSKLLMGDFMVRSFRLHLSSIVDYWLSVPLFQRKKAILEGIRETFRRGLFSACIPTLLPLLDFVMRSYFETDRLNATLQTLRDAFDKAGILPQQLKPGYAIWDANRDPGSGSLFTDIEHDLRLPGVLLSSFVEFGSSYYAWYKADQATSSDLNRHAIIHCATDYWTAENATKLLTFFDLTIRLERVLRIVIHGPAKAV